MVHMTVDRGWSAHIVTDLAANVHDDIGHLL